ncbi:MAG TPA: M50 family metallopeptidase [Candidatus Saccharimonadales bacterium]|nr:M50 family metallopeptidase [Candidatus Saccharimonadales bacterium]
MIASVLSQISSICLSLIGITFIIVFHEFGHYIFCKLFNVYTPTFSIGIGKILYSKKIGTTNFCVSAGPIGGYVEVASEKGPDGSLGFNEIPYYQKVLIMLGGILFNFILTYVFLTCLYFTGMPDSGAAPYEVSTTIVSSVPKESINSALLQPNDQIISMDHQDIGSNLALARKIVAKQVTAKNTQIPVEVSRDGQIVELQLHLKGEKTAPSITKQLEIEFQPKPPLSFKNSIIQAYVATKFYLKSIIAGLKDMVYARNTKGLVGPLMAVAVSSKSAQKGFSSLIFLLAIISINLGFMNLLPLPIFDGGQFVIFTIEAITRKELSEKVRNMIGMSSWVLAIGLLVLFTIRDLYTLIF